MVENIPGAACFHDLTRIHDRYPVCRTGHHTQIVRDKNDGRMDLILYIRQQFHDLCLNGHIQCSGGFIGNKEFRVAGKRHGDHGPLAHTTGKLMRILLCPFLRIGDAYLFQAADSLLFSFLGGKLLMQFNGFYDLFAHLSSGIHTGHGILKDHGDFLAPNGLHLLFPGSHNVVLSQTNGAADNTGGRHGVQLHNGLSGNGLAAAGLSHNGQHLSLIHMEGYAPDGLHFSGIGIKRDSQVLNI